MIGPITTPSGRIRHERWQIWTWVDVKPGLKVILVTPKGKKEALVLEKPHKNPDDYCVHVTMRFQHNGASEDHDVNLADFNVEPYPNGTWEKEKYMLFTERPY